MKLHETYELPMPSETAARLLASESTYARAAQKLTASAHTEQVVTERGGFTTSARLTVPAKGIPPVAAKFVGEVITVSHTETWSPVAPDGSRTAPMTVTLEGLPIHCVAQLSLRPTNTGCALDIEGVIHASVPLVGAKLASAAAAPLLEAVQTIADVLRERAHEPEETVE